MKNDYPEEKIGAFMERLEKLKTKELDLSSGEDLSIAIMNLVSLEEHFFFTASKTDKAEYFDLLDETRKIRRELMEKLVKNPEGEIWCVSKHLLAASMRLVEVGTKYFSRGEKKEAKDLFSKAYKLYSLFWGLNLNLVDFGEIKKIKEEKISVRDKQGGVFEKIGGAVKKLIDCCKE